MTSAADRKAERRRRNRAAHWNARQAAARTNRGLALVLVDYARAVATDRADGDPDHPVWHDLAQQLHAWAQRYTA